MPETRLLDERSCPDFRSTYGSFARGANELDVAVSRIRLAGMNLGSPELGELRKVRVLVGGIQALGLASEADALACDPHRRERLLLILRLLRAGRLRLRIAPLAGWSPDFSVFTAKSEGEPESDGHSVVMIGPHWFERPYSHPGPAFGVVIEGAPANVARKRFEEVWARGHDLRPAVESVLEDALRKAASTGG